jgi:outer membrane protein assembly factor BamD (BamD/ComL family)
MSRFKNNKKYDYVMFYKGKPEFFVTDSDEEAEFIATESYDEFKTITLFRLTPIQIDIGKANERK